MKKNVETKVITIMMAASMAASICPVSAWAVTGDKVAKDDTYVSSTKPVNSAKSDDEWSDYDVTVSLTVENGKISKVDVTPGATYDSENKSYFKSFKWKNWKIRRVEIFRRSVCNRNYCK